MRLEALVNEKYDILTAVERELISHIFRDKQIIRGMNSTQLASFLHVSRTTLVRLWKKLGIQGYAEFSLLLAQKPQDPNVQSVGLAAIVRTYHSLIDELLRLPYERVCRLLLAAPTIYIYGTGNEQKAIAEEFKRILLLLGKCGVDLFDPGEVKLARYRFRPDDVFMAISLSGEGREALEVMRCVQAVDIHTVSLTRWAANSMAQMCEENLYVATKTIQQTSQDSYEMVAAFYLLIDLLLIRCLEQDTWIEKLSEGRKPVETEALFNRFYPRMSENERYICQCITTDYRACADLPIAAFAKRCSVSQALLVRFAKKLGLDGYSELKAMIRLGLNETSSAHDDFLGRVTNGWHKMMDDLMRTDLNGFYRLFINADRVFIYDESSSHVVASGEMKRIFLPLKDIIPIRGHDMIIGLQQILKPDDLVILISLSGESDSATALAETLRLKGIPAVSITGMRSNTLASLCSEALYIHSVQFPLANGLEYETSTPYMILIEYLYLYCRNRFSEDIGSEEL